MAGRGTTGFSEQDIALVGTPGGAPGLVPADLVTLGVSCESCHFGGREHATNGRPIRFLPQSPALAFPKAGALLANARADPKVVNAICAQCHFARGVSTYPDGTGTWNSREAVNMAGGACASAIRCTDCHDPHAAGPKEGGDAPDRAEHVAACTRCHPALADAAAASEHAQHPPEADVSCLDCHMPRIVQGLEHVVRSHRISSPSDARMLAGAWPNACNLCHLDESVAWTAAALAVGWGVRVAPAEAVNEAADGDADRAAGESWLRAREPVVRLVAADAWSRSPFARAALPALVRALDDPFAVNRMFALFAVERVLARRLGDADYDPTAPPDARRAQVAALRAAVAKGE